MPYLHHCYAQKATWGRAGENDSRCPPCRLSETSTGSGRLLFHILALVAEMERELNRERTIAGLAAARANGNKGGGRKPSVTPEKLDTARKLLTVGDKPAKVAKLLQ